MRLCDGNDSLHHRKTGPEKPLKEGDVVNILTEMHAKREEDTENGLRSDPMIYSTSKIHRRQKLSRSSNKLSMLNDDIGLSCVVTFPAQQAFIILVRMKSTTM